MLRAAGELMKVVVPVVGIIVFASNSSAAGAQSRPVGTEAGVISEPLAGLRRPGGMFDRGSYTVTLHADGTVTFDGEPTTQFGSICLGGRHHRRVGIEKVNAIRQAFLDASYFDFKDAYLAQPWSDMGGVETSFHHGGRSKTVWRYFADPSAPKVLATLEKLVDELVLPRWMGYGASWFSHHQNPDGTWTCDGLERQCDPEDRPTCGDAASAERLSAMTTTALCLLPLSAISAPNAPSSGVDNASTNAARRGIDYLLSAVATPEAEADRGQISSFTRAWVCTALCAHLRRDPRRRAPASSLATVLQQAQNDDGSWPAPPDLPDGSASATAWVALALRAATTAGITVDPKRQATASVFLGNHAEALIAAAGTESRGAPRSGRALRAAAMAWCARVWAGSVTDAEQDPMARFLRIVEITEEVGPELGPEGIFFCMKAYLYLGESERFVSERLVALRRLVKQQKAISGCRSGSWDSEDWWGRRGGRVYTTSVMTLCELTFYRYPSILGRE